IFSKRKPVATGGITSGRETIVSTSDLPGHSYRANSHATATPNGRMIIVLSAEIHAVNQISCHSSPFILQGSGNKTCTRHGPNCKYLSLSATKWGRGGAEQSLSHLM